MYRRGIRERHAVVAPEAQVVVKLKQTPPARGALHAFAAEGRMPAGRGLTGIVSVERRFAMEPIFPIEEPPARTVSGVRMLAVAATREPEPELAGLNVITVPSVHEAEKAKQRLDQDPLVEYAYVVPERHPLAARRRRQRRSRPDPLLNRQWGLSAIQLFSAERLAAFPARVGTVVAVIDSGVDSGHPDLRGVFVEERTFTSGPLRDTSGHGTHVSGIIGALANNGRGIRGILRTPRIMSLKALD